MTRGREPQRHPPLVCFVLRYIVGTTLQPTATATACPSASYYWIATPHPA